MVSLFVTLLENKCHLLFEMEAEASHNTHLVIDEFVHEVGSCSSYSFPTILRRPIFAVSPLRIRA